ncbi:OmpH family outer membrane protein [Paracoccus sp. ME4]|uniref:OmpH family outer membrane protein n=1 Tax=Paracoccus sp. ME4 TaxID=3138066 RepID=UPI00398AD0B3
MRRGAAILAAVLLVGPLAAQQPEAQLPLPAAEPQDAELADPQLPPVAAPSTLPSTVVPGPGDLAENAPILTLDLDILYLNSAWGRRAQAELEAEGAEVAAENERLTRLLSSEEAALTQQRATLDAARFRELAEAFDLRATRIRRERAQAVQDLNTWAESDRAAFFRDALPVMGQIMQERGAVAVLDRRTVFVSLDAIDVTQQLIDTLDQRIGDGQGAVPLPAPPGTD